MTESLSLLMEQFETVAREAQTLAFLPRATELQLVTRETVSEFLRTLDSQKQAMVANGDELAANTILAMELSLKAVLHELHMWIILKSDTPDEAWDRLVDAQSACHDALRVRQQLQLESSGLENQLQKLLLLEQLVFPPQMFQSIGGTVARQECSICHEAYDECSHIKRRAYQGALCHVIIHLADLREISIVSDPANKHCRITHFSEGSRMRNKMTWRLEEPNSIKAAPGGSRTPRQIEGS